MLRISCSLLGSLILVLFSLSSIAAGNISVSKTIAIKAPAAEVWAKIKDFNALNGWHPAVSKDEIVDGDNNKVGAVRLLTLNDGGTIKEELQAWDDAGMTYSYKILESVLPVSDYESTIKVEPLGDGACRVSWSGSFSAGKGKDDQTARDTIGGIYDAGLENIVKIMTTE